MALAQPIDLAITEAEDPAYALEVAREHLTHRLAEGKGIRWTLLELGLDPTAYETPREIEDAIADIWRRLPAVTGEEG